jgi:hypothetical protein
MTTDDVTTTTAGLSDRVGRIAAHQSKFLSFLSARVEDRAAVEDILQSAYLKAVEHGSDIPLVQVAQEGGTNGRLYLPHAPGSA